MKSASGRRSRLSVGKVFAISIILTSFLFAQTIIVALSFPSISLTFPGHTPPKALTTTGKVRSTIHAKTAANTPTESNSIATIVNDRLSMLDLADEGQKNKLLLDLVECIEDVISETNLVGIIGSNTLTFARQNNIQIQKSRVTDFAQEVANALERDSNKDEDTMRDRPAELTLGLDVNRIGTFDLDEFSRRVEETFQWHIKGHNTYVSPSFAIIQSSGMGKTKLMKDYRDLFMKNNYDSNTFVQLILCYNSDTILPEKFNEHFDHALDIPPTILIPKDKHQDTTGKSRDKNIRARDQILLELNNIIGKTDKRRIVLLFDESQFLVQGDAGIYVSIKWWLRQSREKSIVAIFAGTLVSLANYQSNQPPLGWTRDAGPRYKNYDEEYDEYVEERMLYPPFYTLTTTGLERINRSKDVDAWNSAMSVTEDHLLDIRRYGYFGRPLFAAMLKALPGETKSYLHLTNDCIQGNRIISARLYAIASRMLLSHVSSESWFEESRKGNQEAIAAILATRIQMGMASYDFVKTATSKGYAYLVHCSTHDVTKLQGMGFGIADIVYPPEPICAAMAMGLMTPCWEIAKQLSGFAISGVSPKKWVEAIGEIFEQKIFVPNRGDAGEIFSALYMLLCGDALRREKDKLMRMFEIDLQSWFHQLVESKVLLGDLFTSKCEINFLQIVRNYFRSHPWFTQQELELMYETAVGCYAFSNCPAVDIVVPVKDGAGNFYPMLISVKCWNKVTLKNMNSALDSMKEYLNDNRQDGMSNAICVVIWLGCEKVCKPIKPQGEFPKEDAFVTVVVPKEDIYGVNKELMKRMARSVKAEVLATHFFAQVQDPENATKCLYSSTKAGDLVFAKKLIGDKNMDL